MATIWRVQNLFCETLNQQDGTVIAHWQFDTGTTTDTFAVWWEYWNTTTGTWVLYESSARTDKWETYKSGQWFQSVWTPDDAPTSTHVRVYVRPWATKDSNGYYRWTSGGAYSKKIVNPKWQNLHAEALEPPDFGVEYYENQYYRLTWPTAPEMDTHIIVYIQKDNTGNMSSVKFDKWKTLGVNAKADSKLFTLGAGHRYRFRAAWSIGGKTAGSMSEATETLFGRPNRPYKLTCRAVSYDQDGGSVRLDWHRTGYSGNGYTLEYSDKANAWSDNLDRQTQDFEGNHSGDGDFHYTIGGLEVGKKWYFRLKRTESRAEEYYATSWYARVGNDPNNEKAAVTVSCYVGATPTAPTPGLTPTTVDIDEAVTLTWTHNCEDGSAQSAWQLQAKVGSGSYSTVSSGTGETSYDLLPSSIASDGNRVYWRVRTKGAGSSWSPWSAAKSFRAYSKPVPSVSVTDDMQSYPLEITLYAGSSSGNAPERCVISILAGEDHERIGADGETVNVVADDVIWSGEHAFAFGETSYSVSLMPQDVLLSEGISYVVTGTVVTRLGMVGEAEPADLTCNVTMNAIYGCDCDAELDGESMAATIRPRCTNGPGGALTQGVTLSVWRVTPDGTELVADGMANDGNALCVDRHPTFGSCTYRVVAVEDATGAVGSNDSTFSWKGPGIVIQWEESFEEPTPDIDGTHYSGHRLVLPYNVDVSEQWQKESSLNEWAGRKHPVSRYGTQRGHTASWSCDIPKLRGLDQTNEVRRLAEYMGDCHVREPYGSGYMAHVQVTNVSYAHADGAVHVTMSVTRVEE